MGRTGTWIWRLALISLGAGGVGFVCFVLVGGLIQPLLTPLIDFPGLVTMRYFDVQGLSLLLGRLDVPCDTIRMEAFVINDKCYGYFGLTPSFLRLLLNGVCLDCMGRWPPLMMIAGGLLTYLACVLVGWQALSFQDNGLRRTLWAVGFAVIMTLGGTFIFIVSEPYPYHEAILWGSAFGLLTLWMCGRTVDTGNPWTLALTLFLLLLTIHARVNIGIGVAIGVMLWLGAPFLRATRIGIVLFCPISRMRSRQSAFVALVLAALVLASPFVVNELKFGTLTPPFSLQPFFQAFPERLKKIEGGNFRLANLPCSATIYLSPTNIAFQPTFPWIGPGQNLYWFASRPLPPVASPCENTFVESLDPSFSLIYGAPAPLLLLGIGMAVLVRRPRIRRQWGPMFVAGSIGAGLMMLFSSISYRYEHDFFLLLAVTGALGWARLAQLSMIWRRVAVIGVVLCALMGTYVNLVASQTSGTPQPYSTAMGKLVRGYFAPVKEDHKN